MDIRLIRRQHANPIVRASGIEPTDPYLEWCYAWSGSPPSPWSVTSPSCLLQRRGPLPAERPWTAARPRCGRRAVAQQQAGADPRPGRTARLGVHQHWRAGRAGDVRHPPTSWLSSRPGSWSDCRTSPGNGTGRHGGHQRGPDGRRPACPPLATAAAWRAAERPGAVALPSTADRPSGATQRALHAVPPIARLDSSATATTTPPDLSL